MHCDELRNSYLHQLFENPRRQGKSFSAESRGEKIFNPPKYFNKFTQTVCFYGLSTFSVESSLELKRTLGPSRFFLHLFFFMLRSTDDCCATYFYWHRNNKARKRGNNSIRRESFQENNTPCICFLASRKYYCYGRNILRV